jgi:Family of unknown function (DUF5995)
MSPAAPAAPIAGVVERMQAVLSPLRPGDGVACFTRLYLDVTRAVQERVERQTFADPVFLARLDANFADLFFAALAAGANAPPAWRPLVAARSQKGIAPIQFALAGMNAHINRDLPVALVETCRQLGVELRAGSGQHADYLRVNAILDVVERDVKAAYLPRRLGLLSKVLGTGRLEDVVTMWDIRRARDAAWVNGEALWSMREAHGLSARFVAALDRSVGLAGRGLLVPADGVMSRLARRFGL